MTRKLLLIMLAAVVLSGCGALGGSATPVAEDEMLTSTTGTLLSSVPGYQKVPQPDGALVMPHLGVTVNGVAIADEIDGDLAGPLFGRDESIRAADGQELVMAQFTPAGSPYGGGSAQLVLTTGDQSRKLETSGVVPQAFVVSADEDAPVSLQIKDAGQVASFDLREAARADDGATRRTEAYLHSTKTELGEKAGAAGLARTSDSDLALISGGDTQRVEVELPGYAEAVKQPWLPGIGWAPEGKTWLMVDVPFQVTAGFAMGVGDVAFEPSLFRLVPDGGQPVAPTVSAAGKSLSGMTLETGEPKVLFEVDPDLVKAEYTVTMAPSVWATSGGDQPLHWVRKPGKHSWTLTFE